MHVTPAGRRPNVASPVAIGDHLYVVDQLRGIVGRWDGDATQGTLAPLIDDASVPPGIEPVTRDSFIGIAGHGATAYVAFTSSTLPDGVSVAMLPDDPDYIVERPLFQVIVRYERDAAGGLSSPVPLTAFQRAERGHSGGGMLALPGGEVLFATGDSLIQSFDGKTAPQDPSAAPGKLWLIDGTTGDTALAATGLRNVQRLTFSGAGQADVAFVDIGWAFAEEVNRIAVADLRDTSEVENFGWGIAGDGRVREGTFHVSGGYGQPPVATPLPPEGDPGFLSPLAQFDVPGQTFAGSGPVSMLEVSDTIDLLFGDLVSGALYATRQDDDAPLRTV